MSELSDKAKQLADQLKAGEPVSVESDQLADELYRLLEPEAPAQAEAVADAVASSEASPSPEAPVEVHPVSEEPAPAPSEESGVTSSEAEAPAPSEEPLHSDPSAEPQPAEPQPEPSSQTVSSADPLIPAPSVQDGSIDLSPTPTQEATQEAINSGETEMNPETPPDRPAETAVGGALQKVRQELVVTRGHIDDEIQRIDGVVGTG